MSNLQRRDIGLDLSDLSLANSLEMRLFNKNAWMRFAPGAFIMIYPHYLTCVHARSDTIASYHCGAPPNRMKKRSWPGRGRRIKHLGFGLKRVIVPPVAYFRRLAALFIGRDDVRSLCRFHGRNCVDHYSHFWRWFRSQRSQGSLAQTDSASIMRAFWRNVTVRLFFLKRSIL